MNGLAEQEEHDVALVPRKKRKHPVNERVHRDGQDLSEGERAGRRSIGEQDAIPTRQLPGVLRVLRVHDKNQEARPGPRRTCRIPQTRTRTRRGRPCPRRAADEPDEPNMNEQRRRNPSRSCGRRREQTTGFRHRKPDEETDAPGTTKAERKGKWSEANRRGNQRERNLPQSTFHEVCARRENRGKRPRHGGTGTCVCGEPDTVASSRTSTSRTYASSLLRFFSPEQAQTPPLAMSWQIRRLRVAPLP